MIRTSHRNTTPNDNSGDTSTKNDLRIHKSIYIYAHNVIMRHHHQ